MGKRTNNVGLRVDGLGYADMAARKVSIEEEMEIFDGLPRPVRELIAGMPARANVLKYHRLVRFQGTAAAIDAARDAAARFYIGAAVQKATGTYWERGDR